jgi:hypothetical protein
VPPLLIVLERWIARRDREADALGARRERERWRQPAIDGIETFVTLLTASQTRVLSDVLCEVGVIDLACAAGSGSTRSP